MVEDRNLDTIFEKKKSGKWKKILLLILFLLIILFASAVIAPMIGGRSGGLIAKERTATTSTVDIVGTGAKDSENLSVFVNKIKIKDITSDGSGRFSFTIALNDGKNTVEVTNSAGSVIYREVISYVSPAPNLDIISPSSGETVNKNEILVKGKTDDGGTKIFVNDKEVPVKEGFFETTVSLTEEDNTIKVVADNGMKQTEKEIEIKYDEDANGSSSARNSPSSSNSDNLSSSTNNNSTQNGASSGDNNSSDNLPSNGGQSSEEPSQPITIYPSKVIISYLKYAADVGNDGGDEFIEIRNTGDESKDLTGWSVSDSDGHGFIFPSFILNAGATVRVNTGKGGFSFNTTDSVWNRVGEPATLKDSAGRTVDIYSY
ncbi:MAG TPA: lamin tail domain-containing protein [Patescibacteria group bacterium]|nr:lamin tail domain-containing protein [Patescibacteria group bacterium]